MITFDATSMGSVLPGTSITFGQTCNGNNRILFVGVQNNGETTDIITGITYAGSAMNRIITGTATAMRNYIYMLVNPNSGSNNVVISSNASSFIRSIAVSYNQGSQTNQPDGSVSAFVNSGTSVTTSLVTQADNCWNLSFVGNSGILPFTAGAGIGTVRNTFSDVLAFGDSNAPKTPAGTYSMNWTSGTQNIVALQVAFRPGPIEGGFFNYLV